jgi:hypothetical protein
MTYIVHKVKIIKMCCILSFTGGGDQYFLKVKVKKGKRVNFKTSNNYLTTFHTKTTLKERKF